MRHEDWNLLLLTIMIIALFIGLFITSQKKPKPKKPDPLKYLLDTQLEQRREQEKNFDNGDIDTKKLEETYRNVFGKELHAMAHHYELHWPELQLARDAIRDLQGKLYLLDSFMKGNPTSRQLKDYETYLFKELWNKPGAKDFDDIPTMNRQFKKL